MNRSKIKTTIDAYNNNAERYTSKFMNFPAYKEQISAFEQRFIEPESEILDIGCGPGSNAKILLDNNRGYTVTGFDLSKKLIQIARENVPGAEFFVEDIRQFSSNKKYDVIIAAFCIVHLSDHDTITLIKKISDILTENGSLYLSFMEGKMPGFETTSFSDDDIFFNYYNRNEIIQILAEHGIASVEVESSNYTEDDGSTTKDVFIFARKSHGYQR